MWHINYQSHDHVISRIRDGIVELVSKEGKTIRLPEKDLPLKEKFFVHQPILRDLVPFASRPRQFLARLRMHRMKLLEENRKTRKVEKSKKNPDGSPKPKKEPKPRKKANPPLQVLMTLAKLEPEERAAALKAMGY